MNDRQYKLIVDSARKHGAKFPTQADWLDFKAAIDEAVSTILPVPQFGLPPSPPCPAPVDLARFFDVMRDGRVLGPTLSEGEVQGCEAIIKACAGWPVAWTAYALATAYHETAGTMQPIREYGRGKGRKYGRPGAHGGQIPYGRGYVQLTWDANYEKADKELGLNGALLKNFDLALDHAIAAQIMVRGMKEGWFCTGRSLGKVLPSAGPATLAQFIAARRIINGTDRAEQIARIALEFQKGLTP